MHIPSWRVQTYAGERYPFQRRARCPCLRTNGTFWRSSLYSHPKTVWTTHNIYIMFRWLDEYTNVNEYRTNHNLCFRNVHDIELKQINCRDIKKEQILHELQPSFQRFAIIHWWQRQTKWGVSLTLLLLGWKCYLLVNWQEIRHTLLQKE